MKRNERCNPYLLLEAEGFWAERWLWIRYSLWEIFTSDSLRQAWCRLRGHPAGVWWYSSRLEPDMHCKNCGEDLG